MLDFFFILDGSLTMYLIPSRVLAGRVMVLLRNYSRYIVGDISSLMRFSGPVELAVPGRGATCGPSGRVDRPGRLAPDRQNEGTNEPP